MTLSSYSSRYPLTGRQAERLYDQSLISFCIPLVSQWS